MHFATAQLIKIGIRYMQLLLSSGARKGTVDAG
jgi:hypothetical protein